MRLGKADSAENCPVLMGVVVSGGAKGHREESGESTMSKDEAKRELARLSSGKLGTLTGLRRYDELDAVLENWLAQIDQIDVSDCDSWIDVWEKVKQ